MIMDIIFAINVFVLLFFIAINGFYLSLIVLSYIHIKRYRNIDRVFRMEGVYSTKLYKPVSIIAPAFNEEQSIIGSVSALLALKYANFEVIVVNDGSSDNTLQNLIEHFRLKPEKRYKPKYLKHKPIRGIYTSPRYPKLIVVDKENGRKADALNAGINIASNDLICSVDADSILEYDVITKMLRPFFEDESTVAVGGVVRVANGCTFRNRQIERVGLPRNYWGRVQAVEYLRAFMFGRVGWDALDSLLIISGAFGVFDRRAVIRVGGYLHDTVGEDMELVMRLHDYHTREKIPYRVRFIAEPVCWTEVPEDPGTLGRQRNRWHRGLADCLFRYRHMTLNPRYGKKGMIAMPYFILGELLSPVIELSGYVIVLLSWWFGVINTAFALLFFAFAILLGMILSISAVLLEEFTTRRYASTKDVLILCFYALLENLGYRQLHAWWRIRGLVDFIRGRKEWGAMTRKGVVEQEQTRKEASNSN
jgi:cellulose synthase/poly-beta-1,6-N-acetylglucosamine synthase-like glycosyltransferase